MGSSTIDGIGIRRQGVGRAASPAPSESSATRRKVIDAVLAASYEWRVIGPERRPRDCPSERCPMILADLDKRMFRICPAHTLSDSRLAPYCTST